MIFAYMNTLEEAGVIADDYAGPPDHYAGIRIFHTVTCPEIDSHGHAGSCSAVRATG
jgi:hypothetical protein